MSPLRLGYLILAIWGAVHPLALLLPWLRQNGLDLAALIAAWQATGAVAGLVCDLPLTAIPPRPCPFP